MVSSHLLILLCHIECSSLLVSWTGEYLLIQVMSSALAIMMRHSYRNRKTRDFVPLVANTCLPFDVAPYHDYVFLGPSPVEDEGHDGAIASGPVNISWLTSGSEFAQQWRATPTTDPWKLAGENIGIIRNVLTFRRLLEIS